jgi:hypothetical protein
MNPLDSDPVPNSIPPRQPIDPAILEWARQTIDSAEVQAGLGEIRRTGGAPLSAFVDELERIARGNCGL